LPDDLTKEPFATRRTIYGFIDRQNLPGMFRTFDFPNPDVSSSQRFATTVPQQALFMMNSAFTQEQARKLMLRAEIRSAASDSEKIRAMYRVLLQRPPESAELKLAQAFVKRPELASESRPIVSAGWQYGYGSFSTDSNRVKDFHVMSVRKDGRVTP
jgi:hypothetical protein